MRTLTFFLLFTAAVQAQSNNLDTLRTDYDVAVTELDLPLDQWHQKYQGQLQAFQAKVQAAGDLDQLIVIKQELDGGAGSIDPKYSALKRLRGIYDARRASIEKAIATKRHAIMADYHGKLKALQLQLTQAGAIDDALKVKEEIEALTIAAKANTSRRPRVGGIRVSGANTRPGRLVIFGRNATSNENMILPASSQGKPYVRVFAYGNYYYALDPEGGVIGRPNPHNDHKLPEEMKPVVDFGMGRHVSVMLNNDSTLSPTTSGLHKDLIPKDDGYVKIAAGYNLNAAIKKNGEVVTFGWNLRETKWAHPNLLRGMVDVVISGDYYIFRARNGKVVAAKYNQPSFWEDPPEGLDGNVVQMASDPHNTCVFLMRDGSVKMWRGEKPPEDLKSARQVRAGDGLWAAQRPDRTWVVWGKSDDATLFNEQLKRLGPLKDFALGSNFFIGIK